MSGAAVRRESGSWLFVLLLFAFAFFVGAAASILAMALLGRIADRLDRRQFLVASAGVFGAGIVGLALTGSYKTLLAALVTLYAASGLYDVGINAAAVDLEKSTGRRFMTLLHAAFSGGAVAGALSAGAMLAAGMNYRFVYLGVLLPLGAVILMVTLTRFPPSAESLERAKEIERSRLYRNVPLLLVAAIATLGLLSEGEMEHWSGIYLRQSLALPALVGASGVAVFHAAMVVRRLGAAGAVLRFGNHQTLLGAGL